VTRQSTNDYSEENSNATGWISQRTGLAIVAVVSVALAIMNGWQVARVNGLIPGVLWGLLFGGSIWLIFIVALFLNRWFRRL